MPSEDEVVLLMLAEGKAGDEHLAAHEVPPAQDRSLEPAFLGDEERSAAPGQPKRGPQPAQEDTRLPGPTRNADDVPVGLGDIDPTVGAIGHRCGVRQALGKRLHPEARERDRTERTASAAGSRRSERESRRGGGCQLQSWHVSSGTAGVCQPGLPLGGKPPRRLDRHLAVSNTEGYSRRTVQRRAFSSPATRAGGAG